MNLPLARFLFILLTTVISLWSATLLGAYNAYNDSAYEESFEAYKSVYEKEQNLDALYGMINALVALHQLDSALALCSSSKNSILASKEVWILGLKDNKKSARLKATNFIAHNSDSLNAVFYSSGAWGFYEAGNYHEAVSWFKKAQLLVPDTVHNTNLIMAQKAHNETNTWTGMVMGGGIGYSNTLISISEDSTFYQYKNGGYFAISSRWDVHNKHTIELLFDHFGASLWFWSEPKQKYFLTDSYQNLLHVAYTIHHVKEKPLHLGGAVTALFSNTPEMTQGVNLYGYDGHDIGKVSLNGHWYATFTESITTLQASPEFAGKLGIFTFSLMPTYIWKAQAPASLFMPGTQWSFKGTLGLKTKHVTFDIASTFGDRMLAAESGGKNIVTITLPHKFTGTTTLSIAPGKGFVTLFSILRYESYEQMNRFIALGGLAISL